MEGRCQEGRREERKMSVGGRTDGENWNERNEREGGKSEEVIGKAGL